MALGARRYTVRRFPDRFSAAEHIDETFVDLWASNMHLSRRRVVIEVEAFELRSGRRVHREKREVELGENRSTELQTLEVPSAWEKEDAVVIAARLVEPESEEVLARVSVYPEPCVLRVLSLSLLTWLMQSSPAPPGSSTSPSPPPRTSTSASRCTARALRARRARFASLQTAPSRGSSCARAPTPS